jgi:hypothetical protein
MGYETTCKVKVDDGSGTIRHSESAKVLLETDDLIVRGDARIKVPRNSITSVASRGGVVTVESPAGKIVLTLGADAAAKWHKKLEEPPKQLIDKLDVKPNAKVWLWGISDAELRTQIDARTSRASSGRSASGCDVVFVEVSAEDDLDRVDRAAQAIVDNGAIWVVHPKGKHGVADIAVFAKAKMLGLTYTKVARISDTLSAEKLVWPRASRGT